MTDLSGRITGQTPEAIASYLNMKVEHVKFAILQGANTFQEVYDFKESKAFEGMDTKQDPEKEGRESWGPKTKIRTYLIRDVKKLSKGMDYKSVADLEDLVAAHAEIGEKFEEHHKIISDLQAENAKLKLLVAFYEEGLAKEEGNGEPQA